VALLPACADSCGCGDSAKPKKPVVSASNSGGASGTSGDGAGGPSSGPDPYKHLRNQLKPMPESDLKQELEAAAKKIDVTRDLGTPIEAKLFASALPDEIDDYTAIGAAATGVTPAQLGQATVATRRYKQGNAVMNVKITDTADAPQLRAEFAPQLTSVGNAPTGEQTGAIEDDIAGIRAYHAKVNASRALALISGRYLVEVVVDNAIKPDDAWLAVTELDPDDLEDAEEAARAREAAKTKQR
jgi:hypothetical protein